MSWLGRIRPERPIPPLAIIAPTILLGSIAVLAVIGLVFFFARF